MGKKPMMLTEWSFPALDSGLPCTQGAGQRFRTQAERASASKIFAETILRMPFMVGYDYFMWVDEPALGITPEFPENSNYGLIREDGRPYGKLVEAFTDVHARAGALRKEGTVALYPPPVRDFEGSRFLAVLMRQAGRDEAASSSIEVRRDGKTTIVRTKDYEVRAAPGDSMLTGEVRFRGAVLGRYNGMVHQWTEGRNSWHGVSQLDKVGVDRSAHAVSLELTGHGRTETVNGRQLFELTHRLIFPEGRNWFVAQTVRVKNLGERPLDLRGMYFRLHSTLGGSRQGDVPLSENEPPRLWGREVGDAWWDPEAAVFWGVVAPDDRQMRIHFWLNESGGQHPDARREFQRVLAPGESLEPDPPLFVIVLAGPGGREEWLNTQQQVLGWVRDWAAGRRR
jgi:hypothetical protein